MGIVAALKTLFGTSEEERELRRKTEEAIKARKDRAKSAAEARQKLEDAQRDLHHRADQLNRRQEEINDEETPTVQGRISGVGA